jgi:hypothetical protein
MSHEGGNGEDEISGRDLIRVKEELSSVVAMRGVISKPVRMPSSEDSLERG